MEVCVPCYRFRRYFTQIKRYLRLQQGLMENTAVGLVRRVKTEAAWKHYPAALGDNGRVKSSVTIVEGREVKHEISYYEPRCGRIVSNRFLQSWTGAHTKWCCRVHCGCFAPSLAPFTAPVVVSFVLCQAFFVPRFVLR